MRKYCCFTAFILMLFNGYAQLKIYDATSVPEGVKKNAYSVKREERIDLEVRSTSEALYKVHKVISIFTAAENNEITFAEYTDQFHSLGDVNISIFDSIGLPLQKYSKSDLTKLAVGSGLVPEGKIYYMKIPVQNFPLTIETNYEVKFNGILNYPDYHVQLPEQAVENSVFTIRIPASIDLRYKKKNCILEPVLGNEGNYKTYTWKVKDLPALEYEEGSVNRESCFPKILLAPNKFELDGNAGDMRTWQQFGQWYAGLANKSRNLSDDRKEFFRTMVKDAGDDNEKIRRIYNYLQKNFRYVSIQLGIGGFKPFDAAFVDKKKYGDCKALSNYLQSCLDAIGIKSYQALVNAEYNTEPVDPDFPRNGFDHVIICVPGAKDSIWLECTSTTNDFGVLGNFTENRNALLISEDGGKLVATPKSKASKNTFSSNTIVNLNEDGSGTAKIILNITGEFRQEFLHFVGDQIRDRQKAFLVNELGFIQPDKFEISYDKNNSKEPALINMQIERVPDFTSGTKFFLNPRIYKLWKYALPKEENRTQDFYFHYPMIKTDTTLYILPDGFGLETLPDAKELKSKFGSFSSAYRFDADKRAIVIISKLVLNEYKIPVSDFAATKKFINDVLTEYNEKIIIRRL